MRLHIATVETFLPQQIEAESCVMASYAWLRKPKARRAVENGIPAEKLLVDSGEYSAWTGTVDSISADEYADWLIEHPFFERFITMDRIGFPKITWEQTERLWDRGLKPVPVYHITSDQREDQWIRRYLEHPDVDMLAIGNLIGWGTRPGRQRPALDRAWRVIAEYEQDGMPPRIHGLGIMSRWAMERYPWRSVDASTPVAGARYGRSFTEDFEVPLSLGYGGKERGRRYVRDQDWAVIATGKQFHLKVMLRNFRHVVKEEARITELWRRRGIVWPGDRTPSVVRI